MHETDTRRHPRADSWSVAWRAGAWSAVRDLLAQGLATVLMVVVRERLERAPFSVAIPCSVALVLLLGVLLQRSSELATAATTAANPARTLLVAGTARAVPTAALTTMAAVAATSNAMHATHAYLGTKLVQRSVRDLCASALAGVLPSCDVVDAQGVAISAAQRQAMDIDRAVAMFLPTAGLFALQEFLVAAPSGETGVTALERGMPYALATSLVEAARALCGTLAVAAVAHGQDRFLQQRPGGGTDRLRRNLLSADTLRQARDAAGMRQHLGLVSDMAGVVGGASGQALAKTLGKTLRCNLKALGEFRAPLVVAGQRALRADLSFPPRARQASPPMTAPPAQGRPHSPGEPEIPTGAPHA